MEKINYIKKLFFIILFVLLSPIVFADATPKLNDRPELEFWMNDQRISEFDSLLITPYINGSIYHLYPALIRRGFLQNVLHYNGTNYLIDERTRIDSFRIDIIYKDQMYKSSFIYLTGDRSLLKFKLSDDGKIKEDHNLLFCRWEVYFKSLFITLIFEIGIVIFLLRKWKSVFPIFLIYIFILNLITHFSLWYIDSHFEVSIITLELIVIVIEATTLVVFFKEKIPSKQIFSTIVIANIASWWIGSIVHYIIK